MPFLSSVIANRRPVLFCARLLIQWTMASSISQTAMDEVELRNLHASAQANSQSFASVERAVAKSSFVPGTLQQTGQQDWRC
jgi:hypothetical protein